MNYGQSTILLVEDEEDDTIFLRRAFQRAGVPNPVQSVRDGEEALAYLLGREPFSDRAKFPFPRVIITDLKMRRMNGLEFLKQVHAVPALRVVPTIVLTSSTSNEDVKQAFLHGACGYMVKPVGFVELEHVVKVIVEYWRLSLLPHRASFGLAGEQTEVI